MMFWLRMVLILAFVVEGFWLCWRAPWLGHGELDVGQVTVPIQDAPLWAPPTAPSAKDFQGKISEFMDSTLFRSSVSCDYPRLIYRAGFAVVVTLLIYGLLGYWLDEKPMSLDVAVTLALSSGVLLSTLIAHGVAQIWAPAVAYPWMNVFWVLGALGMTFFMLKVRQSQAVEGVDEETEVR